jgi:hypothetical protein
VATAGAAAKPPKSVVKGQAVNRAVL